MRVELYTDGACSGNPGPGGWAYILKYGEHLRKDYGYDPATTNNRMEILAVIRGLQALTRNTRVLITTDSQYVKNAFTSGWIDGWKKNGWRTANKQPVKNQDLWMQLEALIIQHQVDWHWVKGHSGHPLNEECDALARLAVREKGRNQSEPERRLE
jgi:ribonuclease HI